MRYLLVSSYQNWEFPTFRNMCHKLASRYIIECKGQGCYTYIGEFNDSVADDILHNIGSADELTTSFRKPFTGEPYSVEFDNIANGYRFGSIYMEFVDNHVE